MGKPTGFLEIERQDRGYEKPQDRLRNWKEFVHPLPQDVLNKQAARCMDCGIPFCHTGCPVNNQIPDFNELNRYQSKTARNAVRKLRTTEDKKEAEKLLPEVTSMLDKLAKKNLIHKNKAANLKSSVKRHVNTLK